MLFVPNVIWNSGEDMTNAKDAADISPDILLNARRKAIASAKTL
ncbi:hypothetical protein [Oculatella sp. FACHB-28]|nr:hypothetical protein [Oculatella sp. FACHB-28]